MVSLLFAVYGPKYAKKICKALPPTARYQPALANAFDSFIIVSGGRVVIDKESDKAKVLVSLQHYAYFELHFKRLSSVDIYDVRSDVWIKGPDMNQARSHHCSCILGNFVYVAGGSGEAGYGTHDTIERLPLFSGALQY